MKFLFKTFSSLEKRTSAEVFILPFWEEKKKAVPAAAMKECALFYQPALENGDFLGKEGETLFLYSPKKKEKRILLLGLGSKKDLDEEGLRRAFGAAVKVCLQKKIGGANLVLPETSLGNPEQICVVVCEGMLLGNYRFEALRENSLEKPLLTSLGVIGVKSSVIDRLKDMVEVISCVHEARNLVNGNADDVTPQRLAAEAQKIGKEFSSVKVVILDQKRLEKEKLGLLLAVGRGARVEPCLILMEYRGDPSSKEMTALVGKGISFDTGGLNLKPQGGIEMQRVDMSGAAAVLGTLRAAARLKLKKNLLGVIPSAENAIGPASYKPGDVYRSYAGKTVEITNTDAEGRLVLSDAIAYIQDHYPLKEIIDLATLTGGIIIALGEELTGLFSNDDKLSHRLIEAGKASGEALWRMPLHHRYQELLKSRIADTANSGGRKGSSILGALFIHQFIKNGLPWAHLDIAGTAYPGDQWATGVGIRLLIQFLTQREGR